MSLPSMIEGFKLDPEWLRGYAPEQAVAAQARYAQGMKVIADSLEAPVGLTPREMVWALNKARLYRYRPTLPPEARHPVPLLLVYALINKPFIFDLAPGRSFVEYMVDHGFDVYLLDWGAPGPEDQGITFDDYVTDYLSRAVRKLVRLTGREISLLGYCLGATLATVYAAHYRDAPIRNLILLTAPLDFSSTPEGSMAMWLAEERLEVDQMIEAFGNIPGELIRFWAKLIKPAENFVGAYVSVWKNLGDEEAVRGWQAINRWVEDVIPFAGGAFRQFVVDYVRGNELIQGHHEIGGRRVDLSNIRAALLNIIAQFDHLVAPSQSETIIHLVSSRDKKLRVVPSTHVGIMASARARYKLWPEVVEWLGPRSRHDAGAPNRTLVG
jgi:polyhydroxyalkanoate synthase subunit PhaC